MNTGVLHAYNACAGNTTFLTPTSDTHTLWQWLPGRHAALVTDGVRPHPMAAVASRRRGRRARKMSRLARALNAAAGALSPLPQRSAATHVI